MSKKKRDTRRYISRQEFLQELCAVLEDQFGPDQKCFCRLRDKESDEENDWDRHIIEKIKTALKVCEDYNDMVYEQESRCYPCARRG